MILVLQIAGGVVLGAILLVLLPAIIDRCADAFFNALEWLGPLLLVVLGLAVLGVIGFFAFTNSTARP